MIRRVREALGHFIVTLILLVLGGRRPKPVIRVVTYTDEAGHRCIATKGVCCWPSGFEEPGPPPEGFRRVHEFYDGSRHGVEWWLVDREIAPGGGSAAP